jgi:hypothetical protein
LSATADYGDFDFGSVSQSVQPLLADQRIDDNNPIASFLIRRRNQYWLLFETGLALAVDFSKKRPQILPSNLVIAVTCACSVEVDSEERIFVGDDDGYVYEFDKGTSFDGDEIEYYVRFAFNHFGAPQVQKTFQKVMVDLEAEGTTTLSVAVDLDYGAIEGVPPQELVVTTGGGALDDLGSNELYYASQIETIAEAYIDGFGHNASLKISGLSATENPHTITGFTYYVTPTEEVP